MDRNGGTNVLDAIDLGAVEQIHKLPRVGREGFDVAALPFCVERFKDQRGFTSSAKPSYDRELTYWEL